MDDERRNRRMMHDERADPAEDEAPEPPGVASAHDDQPVPAARQLSLDRMLYAAAEPALRFGSASIPAPRMLSSAWSSTSAAIASATSWLPYSSM